MRIGMLVNNMEVSGGYHKLVIRLAQQLEKKKHEVTIYTIKVDRKNCYPDDINSVKIKDLGTKKLLGNKVNQYKRLARKITPGLDAIIIHDPESLRALPFIKTDKNTKIIWMLNNQFSPADVGIGAKVEPSEFRHVPKLLRRPDEADIVRQALSKVTDFVTYDEFNRKLIEKYLHKPATVVYAGADLHRFKKYAHTRSFNKKGSYTFLSVGVAFPHRRYEDLIKAAGVLTRRGLNLKIVIVGRQDLHQEYAQKLKSLVEREGADKYIEFKNYVSDGEMIKLYKDSDAFVFINDGFTWGISVFEAVAAKLPVVITSNIGAADLIKDGFSGWVVPPRDPDAVAKAISDIVAHRNRTKKITESAYDELIDFVSWESYAKRMLEVINAAK
jgi:glycosyltransferase involved in cell wall biosynthesis